VVPALVEDKARAARKKGVVIPAKAGIHLDPAVFVIAA